MPVAVPHSMPAGRTVLGVPQHGGAADLAGGRKPRTSIGGAKHLSHGRAAPGKGHQKQMCWGAFAGGGLPMGQVIGTSDRSASMPASDQIGVSHVLGTIMDSLLDRNALRNDRRIDENLLRSINAPTIPQLS